MTLKNSSGFTLIEAVATLVLVGIIAAVAGLGIVQGVEGYLLARENAALTEKVQLALTRMTREMTEIGTVTTATTETVSYTVPGISGSRTIVHASGRITINGDTLLEGVNGLALSYAQDDGSPWTTAGGVQTLAEIGIQLNMNHGSLESGTVDFTTAVNPRNNGVLNGPIQR